MVLARDGTSPAFVRHFEDEASSADSAQSENDLAFCPLIGQLPLRGKGVMLDSGSGGNARKNGREYYTNE